MPYLYGFSLLLACHHFSSAFHPSTPLLATGKHEGLRRQTKSAFVFPSAKQQQVNPTRARSSTSNARGFSFGLSTSTSSTDSASAEDTVQNVDDSAKPSAETTTTTVEKDSKDQNQPQKAQADSSKNLQRRQLGSQELLMLPRQYGPIHSKKLNPVTFPQMTHVTVATLSATPSEKHLKMAIEEAMATHPLLRSRVEGDGEPTKRIDLFNMVRSGDPHPETFVEVEEGALSSNDVLKVIQVQTTSKDKTEEKQALRKSWQESFGRDLDLASFNISTGPLWSLELHTLASSLSSSSSKPCALLLTFNHAISDQRSANMLLDQIVTDLATLDQSKKVKTKAVRQDMPRSLEDSMLGPGETWSDIGVNGMSLNTLGYVAGKAAEGFRNPVMLPDDFTQKGGSKQSEGSSLSGALTTISGRAAGGESATASERRSTLQFRTLSANTTKALVDKCRQNGLVYTNALSAAVALTSSDFIGGAASLAKKERNYKVLQSLDERRFGKQPDPCETMACHAGSMDLMLGPIPDESGAAIRRGGGGNVNATTTEIFWNLAKESNKQTKKFIDSNGPSEAVRVFDFAMKQTDMNNLVHLTAQSESSQGRAYSAGITNVGVFERQEAVRREGKKQRSLLQTKHGKYKIEEIYFATPHARTGCLYQVSCMTVNGETQLTFNPVSPIVSEETAAKYADAFVDLINVIVQEPQEGVSLSLPSNTLSLAAAAAGVAGVALHWGAWSSFASSVMQMKEAMAGDPQEFWAAINFWIFFAFGHPILQPILWISEVLHGSPGPKIADLVPVSFLLGNVVFIGALAAFKEFRNAVNIFALSAFVTYVGAGLEGTAGLGDFNLQLDDPYKGQVVKGCPSYEDVRQPSMDNFDLEKYQGKWYEHKFHDWTQFKEVYDTTLDITLTDGGAGWKDDFAVKGPSPGSNPLSWDKSPVANGAHYFLFGRVDKNDPPGVLRESGFGVEFPNYIVDTLKDPETGEYTESIQFQCLERGGVRVFEGINFLSRSPEMTDEQLQAMHARAEKAGMFPYGAGPEQMHRVERRPVGSEDVDNSWQAMWRAIGFDKLLELLTESIEDGGR